MYTGTVARNSDGTNTSSYGHTITKGPDGGLYTGGAPIGLSSGSSGGVFATPRKEEAARVAFGRYSTSGSWSGSTPDVASERFPSLSSLPVYLWMGALAVLAGVFVSGSSDMFADGGLNRHPAFGVGAALAVIMGYRYLMSWFPTALVVTATSTWFLVIFAWSTRQMSEARVLLPNTLRGTMDAVAPITEGVLRSAISHRDLWALGTLLAGLAFHFIYWRHRRREVRKFGWLFSRGVASAARVLLTLTVTSAVLGQLLDWMRR